MVDDIHRPCTKNSSQNTTQEKHVPSTRLVSLAREIRDQIYTYVLLSPSPIIVWKGKWVNQYEEPEPHKIYSEVVEHKGISWRRGVDLIQTKNSLKLVAINLLLCSKEIGKEAAQVFYQKNVFSFLGEHNWDPIVSWLEKIGSDNRNNLSKLEINAYKPEEVWQRSNGIRVQNPLEPSREPLYPRSPYLHLRSPLKYGLVENINPALETMFQILGERKSTYTLTIDLKLRSQDSSTQYPGQGLFHQPEDYYPVGGWCTLDLPNLIERLRTIYATHNSSAPRLDIIWTGKCPREILDREYKKVSRTTIIDQLEHIKTHGWEIEIIPPKQENNGGGEDGEDGEDGDEWKWGTYNIDRSKELHIPDMVLRRLPLTEPLMGDDPNPYSGTGGYIQPEDEEWELEKVNHWYT
jgi:hypothetical protein